MTKKEKQLETNVTRKRIEQNTMIIVLTIDKIVIVALAVIY